VSRPSVAVFDEAVYVGDTDHVLDHPLEVLALLG
jgi:hypothetical protein